jgi:dGTPase
VLTRQDIEREEELKLAPYAMKSKDSQGRKYKEEEHPYRSVYQRDRDRIIHSTAFRRLEYKTQVFVNHEGDYYRTRLTHTLEVAQIAKSIARTLRLNEDLVEAIALAHDLGHTPFGHSGEEVLHELMKDHGGFDHNLQGLRVVDLLEKRYPDFKGLNLTWEVREGIVKHSTRFNRLNQVEELKPDKFPTLETQVVDVADEIAYDNHDLDDGITSGLIEEEKLTDVGLWQDADKELKSKYLNLDNEIRKYQIIKLLINLQISDLLTESEKRLKEFNIISPQQARKKREKIISFSPQMLEKRAPLREFLLENLYRHYRVIRMSNKAHRFLQDLFRVYLAKPEQLPPSSQKRIKEEGVHRAICDYIAGMTDRYALDEYKKLFDPYEKV